MRCWIVGLCLSVLAGARDIPDHLCPAPASSSRVRVAAVGSQVTLSCWGQMTVNGVVTTVDRVDATDRGRRDAEDTLNSTGAAATEGGWDSLDRGGVDRGVSGINQTGLGASVDAVNDTARVDAEYDSERWKAGKTSEQVSELDSTESPAAVQALGRVTRRAEQRHVSWAWRLNGKTVRGARGDTLSLSSVQLSSSGNYTCHRDGQLAFTVNITVGVAPERPTLSCSRKTPLSKIRCSWTATRPSIPIAHCRLIYKKGPVGEYMFQACSSSSSRRCWCVLDVEEEGSLYYLASLCAFNPAGAQTSPLLRFSSVEIIKPDPPRNVSVWEEEGSSCRLRVRWAYPSTWKNHFYKLKFEVQYQPVLEGEQFSVQVVSTQSTGYTITDALPHVSYLVRVRAREEFDNGQWSDWSSAAYGHTWTAPEPSTHHSKAAGTDSALVATVSLATDPDVFLLDGSGMYEDPPPVLESQSNTSPQELWVIVSWAAGVSLLVGVSLLTIFIARYRVQLKSKLLKMGRHAHNPPCQVPPTPKDPPSSQSRSALQAGKEGVPLVPHPASGPPQEEVPPHEPGEQRRGYYLMNMGYFLVRQ
ncbi:interleukin-6 receptor subunit alpha isoform X2 [Lepisosteus oculatus]|uniref:interleukin-6 receptor subunit alpha isoform X2 n=1 Tax=Lepisosteus oculatus TaxID=7918 RepID=UPI003720B989